MTPEIEELGKHEDEHLIGSDSNDLLSEWNDLLEVLNKLISKFLDIKNIFQENLSRKLVNLDISSLDKNIQEIESKLAGLKTQPNTLIKKTNALLRASYEENKAQKENLLYKTKEFADMQAKLASVNTNLHFIEVDIENINSRQKESELEVQDLITPVEEMQVQLNKKLESRLIIEMELSRIRKDIEKNYESIRALERSKAEQEQNTVNQRQKLEDLRLELQAYKIEEKNIEQKY